MRERIKGYRDILPKKRGLTLKIITSILAASIIPLLFFFFIARYDLTESAKVSLEDQLKQRASSVSYSVDLALGGQIDNLHMISISKDVISFVINANYRYKDSTTQGEIEEASQKWIQAQGTAAIDSDLATNDLARYLNQTKGEEDQVASVFITDQKGALISTINEVPKYFHGHDLWWKKTYNEGRGKSYISDIYYDETKKGYLLDIALPIKDGGQIVGIIKKILVVKEFFDRSMGRIKKEDSYHAMLVDSKGKVIFCPLLDIGTSINDKGLIQTIISPNPVWADVADDAHGGKSSLIGSAPLERINLLLGEQSSDIGWYTFIWQDQTKANNIAKRSSLWILIYGLITIGMSLTIGYLASRRVTSPLKKLIEGSGMIGKGDLGYHIDINTSDEIGELAERVNQIGIDFIGERKRLEKKIIDYAEELKKKESEWARDQLITTEKVISIERFAEGIAHEINNHLGIIFGFIQVMLKDCDHVCHSYEEMKIIEKHINYTKKIMDDLLEFARVSGLEKEEVDINKNIEGTALLLEQRLSLENISLIRDLAADLPKVVCDPKKLQHVYVSIIANSIHAMKKGGILTISTSYEKEKNYVEIRFRDTGSGIPDSDIERIFDPFYTKQGQEEGIGLSLSASYGIIKEHQGEILVESKEGEGTIYTILLPINQESQIAPSEYSLRRIKA